MSGGAQICKKQMTSKNAICIKKEIDNDNIETFHDSTDTY